MNNCQNLQPPEIPSELSLIQSKQSYNQEIGYPNGPIKTDITQIKSDYWKQYDNLSEQELKELLNELVEDFSVQLISLIQQVNNQANTVQNKFLVDTDDQQKSIYRTELQQQEIRNLLDYIGYNNARADIIQQLQDQVNQKRKQLEKLDKIISQIKSKYQQ